MPRNSIRIICVLVFASFLGSFRPAGAQAGLPQKRIPISRHHYKKLGLISPLKAATSAMPHLSQAISAQFPTSAGSQIVKAICPPEAAGAACGFVNVPFDREHPWRAKIAIYFELYLHSKPGPAQSAIVADPGGGGGLSASANRSFFLYLYGPNLETHDLLLIDSRGRGLSRAIDCEELQHGTAPFPQGEADCAAQLGDAASRYGAGDIAQDVEAVRAALGYDKVDYYGSSYGSVNVEAYATRFGEHLRSILLDSPLGSPGLTGFTWDRDSAKSQGPVIAADCRRSPSCFPDHPNPLAEIEALVNAIRTRPVEGDTHDASGNAVHVRIDETALLSFVMGYQTGRMTGPGEVLAAGAALRNGDSTPLLRLGAEGTYTLEYDAGDPAFFSAGAAAAACVDHPGPPWTWSVSGPQREQQFARAVASLPANFFAPFSRSAVTDPLFSTDLRDCIYWEKPTASSPVVRPDATYPHVPTLVLSGELDNLVPTELNRKVAALYPDSILVTFAEVEHDTAASAQCAADVASGFIETLHPDTSCASEPNLVFPAVGRFPSRAKDAHEAEVDPAGQNQIGVAERKVVTVAVAAATDALQRSLVNFYNGDGSGNGAVLRGGTFHADFADTWTLTLSDCAFARDVVVNGRVTWESQVTGAFSADLNISGTATAGGTLHVEGSWLAPGPVGKFKVSGILGGRKVAALVPEA